MAEKTAKKTAESKPQAQASDEKPAASNEKLPVAGEQKKASDERLVHDGASRLLGGPTQDDLNPAFAPTKVEE